MVGMAFATGLPKIIACHHDTSNIETKAWFKDHVLQCLETKGSSNGDTQIPGASSITDEYDCLSFLGMGIASEARHEFKGKSESHSVQDVEGTPYAIILQMAHKCKYSCPSTSYRFFSGGTVEAPGVFLFTKEYFYTVIQGGARFYKQAFIQIYLKATCIKL